MIQNAPYHALGRRKSAVAQVRITQGAGAIIVNGRPMEEVFPRLTHRNAILQPLQVTGHAGAFLVQAKVKGGGVTGWADAIRHAIARALSQFDEELKPRLRQYRLLTRDPRVKERKKYGLKRARKAPQYTKR